MKYERFTYDENSNSIFFSVIKSTNDSQRCLSGSCNIEKMQCTCGFPEEYKSLCSHMIKALIIKKIEIFNLIPSYYKCNYSFEYSKINFHFPKVIGMDETAAIRNARTMVTGAENKGRQDSYARATADGIILHKEWLATNDGRTRHWHAELDGQTVPQDKPFSNAVGLIMFPGDPGAHPANVYNCRCSMAAVVKGFKKVR